VLEKDGDQLFPSCEEVIITECQEGGDCPWYIRRRKGR
jgi:hypothetical protein